MPVYSVWYMRPSFRRDGIMGYSWVKECHRVPNPNGKLNETHAYLKQVKADDFDDVFHIMNHWEPTPEEYAILDKEEIHRSMSVGDIIVDERGDAFFVDSVGFVKLS